MLNAKNKKVWQRSWLIINPAFPRHAKSPSRNGGSLEHSAFSPAGADQLRKAVSQLQTLLCAA
jgi:hypothetical protein